MKLLVVLFAVAASSAAMAPQRSRPPFDPDGSGTPLDWSAVVANQWEVRCSKTTLTVLLHFDPEYTLLSTRVANLIGNYGRLSVGDGGAAECNSSVPRDGSIVAEFALDACGVEMRTTSDNQSLVTYKTKVLLQVGQSVDRDELFIHEVVDVECVHPLKLDEQHIEYALNLFESPKRDGFKTALIDFNVPVGHFFEIESRVIHDHSWYKSDDLFSFPVECWTAPQDTLESRPQRTFLKDGCPALDRNGEGLSTIHTYREGPVRTRVKFTLNRSLIPKDESLKPGVISVLTVHCRVLPCVQSFTKAALDIPKCPTSHYCSGEPTVTHRLPAHLRSTPTTHLTSHALLVSDDPSSGEARLLSFGRRARADADRTKALCLQQCRELLDARLLSRPTVPPRATEAPSEHYVYVRGISTTTTAAVALACFALGMLLTAAVWFVHAHTQPRTGKAEQKAANGAVSRTPPVVAVNGASPHDSASTYQPIMLNPI